MNLNELAQIVKSDFTRLQEGEIVGRIVLISGRNVSRSLTGYKMLREQKLIPEDFVEKETDGALQRMIEKNPAVLELLDRLDCIPGKMKVGPKPEPAVEPITYKISLAAPEF